MSTAGSEATIPIMMIRGSDMPLYGLPPVMTEEPTCAWLHAPALRSWLSTFAEVAPALHCRRHCLKQILHRMCARELTLATGPTCIPSALRQLISCSSGRCANYSACRAHALMQLLSCSMALHATPQIPSGLKGNATNYLSLFGRQLVEDPWQRPPCSGSWTSWL
jgi:hypothetical protein